MNRKLVASLISVILLLQFPVSAADFQAAADTQNAVQQVLENEKVEEQIEDAGPVLSLEEAIQKGLENSYLLQQVKNQASIAKVVSNHSDTVRSELKDAAYNLKDASYLINDGRNQIYAAKNQLDSAEAAFNEDRVPQNITFQELIATRSETEQIYLRQMLEGAGIGLSGVAIPAGTTFEEAASGLGQYGILVTADQIRSAVRNKLDSSASTLAASQEKLEASTQAYLKGNAEYQAALKYALSSVNSKLSTSTISEIDPEALGDLIVKMTKKQDEVTSYSVDIYKNQIALLIEKNYFEALKQQELLGVKRKAEERGRVQYELAKAAYETGAKSKDDMIIAKTYYDSTIMNTQLQEKDYEAALITLKKNLNVPYDEAFRLESTPNKLEDTYVLEEGIKSGLTYRLEIKMAQAQQDVLAYLMSALKASDYSASSHQCTEVKLLQDQAKLELESKKADVEGDIRTSYTTMMSMKKVVEKSNELTESAKETLEIAKVKYEVGYGYPNSLLESLNLEGMSGTVVEVISAEENLMNIEEKRIEAINGYNLSQLKYLNDIGILPYQ